MELNEPNEQDIFSFLLQLCGWWKSVKVSWCLCDVFVIVDVQILYRFVTRICVENLNSTWQLILKSLSVFHWWRDSIVLQHNSVFAMEISPFDPLHLARIHRNIKKKQKNNFAPTSSCTFSSPHCTANCHPLQTKVQTSPHPCPLRIICLQF